MSEPKHQEAEFLNSVWCLYNRKVPVVIDGLAWNQFKAIVESLSESDYKLWFFWREGQSDWQPIKEIIDEILSTEKAPYRTAPTPPPLSKDLDPEGLTGENTAVDKRMTKRFRAVIPVEFDFGGGQTFVSKTEDLSVGGMKVQDALPGNVFGQFDCLLKINKKETLKLGCIRVESDETKKRIKFLPNNNINELRKFLLYSSFPAV